MMCPTCGRPQLTERPHQHREAGVPATDAVGAEQPERDGSALGSTPLGATPSPAPLSAAECGVLGLCELPKGHDGMHSTSVDRAADLDATHGYMVFEGPNGELMRTPYRAARATLAAARTPRETPPDLEGLRAAGWIVHKDEGECYEADRLRATRPHRYVGSWGTTRGRGLCVTCNRPEKDALHPEAASPARLRETPRTEP